MGCENLLMSITWSCVFLYKVYLLQKSLTASLNVSWVFCASLLEFQMCKETSLQKVEGEGEGEGKWTREKTRKRRASKEEKVCYGSLLFCFFFPI